MVMKQTQTKMFDFADIGLDFSAGSKSLFPDRFKKMLAQGYNTQTVSSVAVAGNQVTFTYGVTHGYVADRVLKVNAPELSSINGGEFVIDSVTTNTVTLTIDSVPASISGSFTTQVASLGWSLEYENANIHVYKMKHIDNTDRYARLCFQDNANHRNAIAICIGKTFDVATGFINDTNALQSTKDVMTPSAASLPKWDFGYSASSSFNNSTYSAGYNEYGKACVVGSPYHLALLGNNYYRPQFNAILPVSTLEYDILQYPLILCTAYGYATNNEGKSNSSLANDGFGAAYIGNRRCRFDITGTVQDNVLSNALKPTASSLPVALDPFNTTTTIQVPIYDHATSQFLGYCIGIYIAMYANDANAPDLGKTLLPKIEMDIDYAVKVAVHDGAGGGDKYNAVYVAMPIEEVRLA